MLPHPHNNNRYSTFHFQTDHAEHTKSSFWVLSNHLGLGECLFGKGNLVCFRPTSAGAVWWHYWPLKGPVPNWDFLFYIWVPMSLIYQLFMLCKWKKYDKTSSEFFTAWVSDLVKFPEKGTMSAIWPSTERVKLPRLENCVYNHVSVTLLMSPIVTSTQSLLS
jgi:hypothetical protein